MKKITLKIEGIHCKSCEMLINDALQDLGVKDMKFRNSMLSLSFDEKKLSIDNIKKAVSKEGYKVVSVN